MSRPTVLRTPTALSQLLAAKAANATYTAGQGHVYQSTADPTTLGASAPPAGAEYVWFHTDGNGVLLDILAGKA